MKNIFFSYIIPLFVVLALQFIGAGIFFGAGLACGGSGGPSGCEGLVLATYIIVGAPITGLGLSLLYNGDWLKALKFLFIVYVLEILPFLLTGNIGDVIKNLVWSLPSYAKPVNYPLFFWEVTLPILLFLFSPILFGGIATAFRQKKHLIIIGSIWAFIVIGYFIGEIVASGFVTKSEMDRELTNRKTLFHVREPSYLPDFIKKTGERSSGGNGVLILYNGECLMINESPGPISFSDSERIIDMNGTKAGLTIDTDGYYRIRFQYSGVNFSIDSFRGGDCSKFPLLSEEEFLKIARSMIQ